MAPLVLLRQNRWLCVGLALVSEPAAALDLSYSQRSPGFGEVASQLTISGPIMIGDAERFQAFLRREPQDAWFALNDVRLESPGGDIEEAMRLATILRGLYVHIQPQGNAQRLPAPLHGWDLA